MQTVTIKVDDLYADKLFSLLELFPKKYLQISREDKKQKELEKHRKAIEQSLLDSKEGRVFDTGIVVKMQA